MSIVQLQLDEITFKHAQRVAQKRHLTVEMLVKDIINFIATRLDTEDPYMGMFAQEPELIDQIVAAAMRSRETTPLRLPNG